MPAVHKHIRANRIFTETLEPAPGVTPETRAVAGICEVDSHRRPFMGASGMKVYSVVPLYNRIEVRGEVDWDSPLLIRVTVIYE